MHFRQSWIDFWRVHSNYLLQRKSSATLTEILILLFSSPFVCLLFVFAWTFSSFLPEASGFVSTCRWGTNAPISQDSAPRQPLGSAFWSCTEKVCRCFTSAGGWCWTLSYWSGCWKSTISSSGGFSESTASDNPFFFSFFFFSTMLLWTLCKYMYFLIHKGPKALWQCTSECRRQLWLERGEIDREM